MEEIVFTALGRDPTPAEPKGFAGVKWTQGDRKYTVWVDLEGEATYYAFLPRVFDWAMQTVFDFQRRDRNEFFKKYFLNSDTIPIGGIPLNRRFSEKVPFDDVEPETFDTSESAAEAAPATQG